MWYRPFLILTVACSVTPAVHAVDVLVSAAAGQPYGVARIEIPVVSPVLGQVLPPITVTSSDGRVLFPVSDDVRINIAPPSERPVPRPGRGRLLNRVGSLIRELAQPGEQLQQTTSRSVAFLVLGQQPVQVQLSDSAGPIGTYEVALENDPQTRSEVILDWWASFTAAARQQIAAADYPTAVESYLVAMLAGRLGLPLPEWYSNPTNKDDELLSTLKLVAGAEGARDAAFRMAAIGASEDSAVSVPLPDPPRWSPLYSRDDLADVPVEPIASRVPPECFYIRYGEFENYLWFRDLTEEYGGDITRMITLRGIENSAFLRMESQLNAKTTQLTRMLGPSVIEDQALIGQDLFVGDGASMGVLFLAKNPFLLQTSLDSDRSTRAASDEAVTLRSVEIAGRTVSLLSSADNRVRSFLATDGAYFLITNSHTMVQRFFEVGESSESLATTASYRLARQLMPLERRATVFAYFSPEMLRGLFAPKYLIELRRRLYAGAEVAMVHMARLAAAQESAGSASAPVFGIEDLVSSGFLPRGFGVRPDGSGLVSVADEVMDTLRGARGTFLPIADVDIEQVTPEESVWYNRIAEQYSQRFPTIDPILAAVYRQQLDSADGGERVERITVHAEIAPWRPEKYGDLARQLGPPTNVAMQFAPDDIVAVQAHVDSEYIGLPTHLFAAIKDTIPPEPEEFDGILNIYRSLRSIPGYLGAWPQPGALDRLPLGLGRGQPIGPARSRLLGGLYRYNDGEFSVLSFQPDVMEASLPFLKSIDVEDSAQIRARVGNLRGSQIENWVNGQLYKRASESSVAGATFLNTLSSQLGVPSESSLLAAERVLGARLQCTLGGQYTFWPEGGHWISSAWNGSSAPTVMPPDYVAPAVLWFRGATAKVTQYEDRLVADAVIDVARD